MGVDGFFEGKFGRVGGGGIVEEVPDDDGADWSSGRGSSGGIFSS